MIASFHHDFVFIKTKKTAGSTAEAVLAPHCSHDDVVTPASVDEPIQPGGAARNFTRDAGILTLYNTMLKRGADPGFEAFLAIDARCRAAGDYFSHMTAAEARAALDPGFWDRAFKFTIERHPYEKAVSQAWFKWARAGLPEGDFDAFFDRSVRQSAYDNSRFYLIDGQVAVDRIVRYERLDEELREIAARFGVELPDPLPRAKGGFRQDRRPAAEILTDDQKAAVYQRCRVEFDLLGYEP